MVEISNFLEFVEVIIVIIESANIDDHRGAPCTS